MSHQLLIFLLSTLVVLNTLAVKQQDLVAMEWLALTHVSRQRVAQPTLFTSHASTICQTISKHYERIPLGFMELLAGYLRDEQQQLKGEFSGTAKDGRPCFTVIGSNQTMCTEFAERPGLSKACANSKLAVNLENDAWYLQLKQYRDLQQSALFRNSVIEDMKEVRQNRQDIINDAGATQNLKRHFSLIFGSIMDIESFAEEAKSFNTNYRQSYTFDDSLQALSDMKTVLDLWFANMTLAHHQSITLTEYESIQQIVLDQWQQTVQAVSQNLTSVTNQLQSLDRVIQMMRFVGEMAMGFKYYEDLFVSSKMYNSNCTELICPTQIHELNITSVLHSIMMPLKNHLNLNHVNQVHTCLGSSIQSIIDTESLIDASDGFTKTLVQAKQYGLCLERIQSTEEVHVVLQHPLPLPDQGLIKIPLNRTHSNLILIPNPVSLSSLTNILVPGRIGNALNNSQLIDNLEAMRSIQENLLNNKRSLCWKACPDGQASHCDGDDIVCEVVGSGLWAKGGVAHACSNAPFNAEYYGSGGSNPDCPFRCTGRHYKKCQSGSSSDCQQWECPSTPPGKYPLLPDGQELGDCRADFEHHFFLSGGLLDQPASCTYSPSHLVHLDFTVPQQSPFTMELWYKADLYRIKNLLQADPKNSSSVGIGLGLIGAYNQLALSLHIRLINNQLIGRLTYSSNGYMDLKSSTTEFVLDQQWHHYRIQSEPHHSIVGLYRDSIFHGALPFAPQSTEKANITIVGGIHETYSVSSPRANQYYTPGLIEDVKIWSFFYDLDRISQVSVPSSSLCQTNSFAGCLKCQANEVLRERFKCKCKWNHYRDGDDGLCKPCPLDTNGLDVSFQGIQSCRCHPPKVFNQDAQSCITAAQPFEAPYPIFHYDSFIKSPPNNVVPVRSQLELRWPHDVLNATTPYTKTMTISITDYESGTSQAPITYQYGQQSSVNITLNYSPGPLQIKFRVDEPYRMKGQELDLLVYLRYRFHEVYSYNGTVNSLTSEFPLFHKDDGEDGMIVYNHIRDQISTGWKEYALPPQVKPGDTLQFYYRSSDSNKYLDSPMTEVGISYSGNDQQSGSSSGGGDQSDDSSSSTTGSSSSNSAEDGLLPLSVYHWIFEHIFWLIALFAISVCCCCCSGGLCIFLAWRLNVQRQTIEKHRYIQQIDEDVLEDMIFAEQ